MSLAVITATSVPKLEAGWLADPAHGGLVIGVFGGLEQHDLPLVRRMLHHSTTGLAIAMDVDAWVGQGDGSGLRAVDTAVGRVGALACWEHYNPLARYALMAAVLDHRARGLTDLRVQVRAETHLVTEVPRLIAAVERFRVDYVVFNDHLEEGFQMRRGNPDGFAHWARKAGLTEDELFARMEAARAHARAVPRALCAMAEAFDRLGVTYGSHDDPDAETREVYRMIGARVAEFPTTLRAAAAARAGEDPVLMGAPNVVRGGSQAGNVAAVDLIRAGLCDGLVSDYHLPALPMAVWALVDGGVMPLEKAWALVSSGPARVLRMADRGRIADGLRADLVVVDPVTREVVATIAGGRLSHLSGRVAARFMDVRGAARMAAE